MRHHSGPSTHWFVLVLGTIGVACPTLIAAWLFVDAAAENRGSAGSILQVGFGFILVLLSVLILALGAIYWKDSVPADARTKGFCGVGAQADTTDATACPPEGGRYTA
jgi:hypothetical protein